MKSFDIRSRLAQFTVTAALVFFFCSCEKREGQLDFQILTNTVWYEEHSGTDGLAVGRLYEFDEGGMVSIYIISGGAAFTDNMECRYIFTPADEFLAIESVGAFNVEDIGIEAISLRYIESGKPFGFTKYTGDISLP